MKDVEERKTDIARKYVEKYLKIYQKTGKQFSKKYVGLVMFNENPERFKDAEDGRWAVKAVLGSSGVRSRTNSMSLSLIDKFAFINEGITDTPNPEPFIIPKAYNNMLVISDLHSVFYDKQAVYTALEYGKKKGCNGVLINGDFLDHYQHSRFSKNPRITSYFIHEEQEWGVEMLKLLQDEFGYVVYKLGNHDTRRELQLFNFSGMHPEVLDTCTLSEYLSFERSHVQFVEDYRMIKVGNLPVYHGHEFNGGGGVNAARGTLLKSFSDIMTGHSHTTQDAPMKDLFGNIYMSYKVGCLCILKPKYSPINQYNHGFARIETEDNGDFMVENKRIIDYKVR